jgi:uncharacterized protein (TIGR03435 family)
MRNNAEWKRLFLTSAGVVALAASPLMDTLTAPRLSAQSSTQTSAVQSKDRPTFEVASIKVDKAGLQRPSPARLTLQPGGRLTTNKLRLRDLLESAYQLSPYQWQHISGQPAWSESEYFDIEAKAAGNPGAAQIWLMLQSLLVDRFRLVVHWETKQVPLFALVVLKSGKLGPRLHPHTDDANCIDRLTESPSPTIPNCGSFVGLNSRVGYKVTMDDLARDLGFLFQDRPLVNQTGLSGTFDLSLLDELHQDPVSKADAASDPSSQSWLFTALQEQLGLKLESQTGPVDVLVIDHVEEPSPN